jgi:alcohol dehydrogenase class IV
MTSIPFAVRGEPTVDSVAEAVAIAHQADCQFVVAIGGGSALDTGKAVAALLTNRDPIRHYLEVIGEARPLTERPAPCLAIPTTSGTGAEATCNAVLSCPSHRVKVSLRHPHILPDLVIVDPTLTLSLPPHITATTGMDALTQLIEPFLSRAATPITDAIAREMIPRAAHALPRVCKEGTDLALREEMALASLCSGMALANAGLGAVHGLAGPMGGMIPGAAHGAICAALLVPVLSLNLITLRRCDAKHPTLERFQELARMLTGDPSATPETGIATLHALVRSLPLPNLAELGLTRSIIPELTRKALAASSMKGNPITLQENELRTMLENELPASAT